ALAAALASGQPPPAVTVPVGFTTFPGEIWAAPRSWVEAVYPGVAYFNEVERGGHFAAWEEPELFSDEVRAAFRSLRDETSPTR
ncbi:MAG: epoxide hydrolase, partial [Gaiellaceae bacterium]